MVQGAVPVGAAGYGVRLLDRFVRDFRPVLVAVDGGARDNAAAEHQLHHVETALGAAVTDPAYVASTHVVEVHVVNDEDEAGLDAVLESIEIA